MKIFQIQHESEKTLNKDGHHEKERSSNSEALYNLVHISSHHSSIKSRARTYHNQILRMIPPTDDPALHVHGISFGGASIFFVSLFIDIS